MPKYIDLKECLVEDLKWAKANEWDVPFQLILDLEATIELLNELEVKIEREE